MSSTGDSRRTPDESIPSIRGAVAGVDAPRHRSERRPKGSVTVLAVDPPNPDHRLTLRQLRILEAIEDLGQRRGYSPTLREIGEAVGLASASSVSYQLSILQDKGHLSRDAGLPRTAVVRPPSHPAAAPQAEIGPEVDAVPQDIGFYETADVPLLGRIAAGRRPLVADGLTEDIFPLPRQLVGEGALFLLEVTGDSMIDAAISDGDWVVVREQPKVENGEVVAAMIDDVVTVKTFKRSEDHVWLIAHNPNYQPILGDEATILGKVVAVLRRL